MDRKYIWHFISDQKRVPRPAHFGNKSAFIKTSPKELEFTRWNGKMALILPPCSQKVPKVKWYFFPIWEKEVQWLPFLESVLDGQSYAYTFVNQIYQIKNPGNGLGRMNIFGLCVVIRPMRPPACNNKRRGLTSMKIRPYRCIYIYLYVCLSVYVLLI